MSSERSAQLVEQIMANAKDVPGAEGRAWIGGVSLVEFFQAMDDEDELEWLGPLELLEQIVDDGPEVLVHLAVRNPGPPDWDWWLNSFRIGDRGFIMMSHEDPMDGPMTPVFSGWSPYDDQDAFEAAFVATFAQDYQAILLGTHFSLSNRVSQDLWRRAILAAMEASGDWSQLADLGDFGTTAIGDDDHDAVLEHYVTTRNQA